ncbi:MAG: hypothetical protein AUK54_08930 [Helicobacteraceae bacterium CG2_30_36_10]|nr:MAG: hypothetical protein AUK54_08930 [Helicobacteraceae bacterium CG2_30_36_10]
MWLTKLKIAIVEQNTDLIDKLLDEVPKFSNVEDAQKAMHLLREASILLHTLKDETSENMKQIKRNTSFIKSTQPQLDSKLNIKS